MAITKANILTEVRARTGRGTAIADIDDELTTILMEVSALVPGAVQTSGTVTIAAFGWSVARPSDFVKLVSASTSAKPALEKVSFEQIQAQRAGSTTVGVVTHIATRDGNVYVWPVATASTVVTLYYQYEESDPDTIGLDDVCEEALIEGVCHKIELGLGALGSVPEQAVTHGTYYDKQIALLQSRYGA